MQVVALISGGKDSVMNMLHCVKNGHHIEALANMRPIDEAGHEIDSFLYQTVGHDLIYLISEAMQLPLYQGRTQGEALAQDLEYEETRDDETEDLYNLLSNVLSSHPGIQGVSVGAILSSYQRTRVEHVCARLGLRCLAFLWKRDQIELLSEIVATLDARIIKVAAIGLTQRDLGKSLLEIQPHLLRLHDKYQVHPCGEGGEYETFVVDCPLFHRRIVVDGSQIVEHSAGDVAYLRMQAHSEPKAVPFKPSDLDSLPLPSTFDSFSRITLHNIRSGVYTHFAPPDDRCMNDDEDVEFFQLANISAVGDDIADEVHQCMDLLRDKLGNHGCTFEDVAFCSLLVSSMASFSAVNEVYAQYFLRPLPPSRMCIAVSLPSPHRFQISALCGKKAMRTGLHVQSLSYWAPANIGPYSQAIKMGGYSFIAGQIPLLPPSLTIDADADHAEHAVLSVQHVRRIMEATGGIDALYGIAFVTIPHLWAAIAKAYPFSGPFICVQVGGLPRGASCELAVVARTSSSKIAHCSFMEHTDERELRSLIELSQSKSGAVLLCTEAAPKSSSVQVIHVKSIVDRAGKAYAAALISLT